MAIKRVLIAAGGTGGHLFPAQGFAQDLSHKASPPEILFAAGGLSTSRYFDRDRFAYREVACKPILLRHPIKSFFAAITMFKGLRQSIALLKEFKPDVVVGFGSYYTIPTLLAARWLNIPIILHEANSVPGKANQWLAPLATRIGIHFPSTAVFFKGKAVVVGLPLREGYRKTAVSKAEALAYYGFSSELPTLLVCGGSQGAHAINKWVGECLPLLKRLSVQVIHLTGNREQAAALTERYAEEDIPANVKPFEDKMQMAWGAADVFIGRAGASTIAEAIEFEVPGLLIPYPFATDLHQDRNADFFADEVKGGWKQLECDLTAQRLGKALEALFEKEQLASFQAALKHYKERPHQTTLTDLVLSHHEKGINK